jgi:hypothetical protein
MLTTPERDVSGRGDPSRILVAFPLEPEPLLVVQEVEEAAQGGSKGVLQRLRGEGKVVPAGER